MKLYPFLKWNVFTLGEATDWEKQGQISLSAALAHLESNNWCVVWVSGLLNAVCLVQYF